MDTSAKGRVSAGSDAIKEVGADAFGSSAVIRLAMLHQWDGLVGESVQHPSKGGGTIVAVEGNAKPELRRVVVEFDSGVSKFSYDHAPKWLELTRTDSCLFTQARAVVAQQKAAEEAAARALVREKEERDLIAAQEAERTQQQKAASAAARAKEAYIRHVTDNLTGVRLGTAGAWVSTCWSCSSEVHSFYRPRCSVCGWVVCGCGACEDPKYASHPSHRSAPVHETIYSVLNEIITELVVDADVSTDGSYITARLSAPYGKAEAIRMARDGTPLRSLVSVYAPDGTPLVVNGTSVT